METSELWRVVPNFPSTLFKDGYSLPRMTSRSNMLDSSCLSNDVHDFMNSHGLKLCSMFILFNFYLSNQRGAVHHDIAPDGNTAECAINIEISGKSELHFFQPRDPKEIATDKQAGYTFARYEEKQMTEIGCLTFDSSAYLVRVGYPHRANALQGPRQLITLRFGHNGRSHATWKEAVECLFGQ
jgi:hypothetical protein